MTSASGTGSRGRSLVATLPWTIGLLGLTVLFWKLRIFDSGGRPDIVLGSFDIYTEHYPMTRYGFEALSAGRIPHWNPHQLGGMPFLAIPHVGLLYPGNWIYAFFETAAATELSYVLHLFWAGLGAFLLARTLGLSPLAGMASALTFMWSGWMGFYANQASLVSGMSWLPMTLYLIERTVRGSRLAGIAVALAVGCQLLNGATEFFVHNMYASGAYSALRLAQLGIAGHGDAAVWRGAGLLGAVAAGIGLASPQLLPSLELASLSVRGESALSIEQAVGFGGAVAPVDFFDQALRATGIVAVGVLPFAGLLLGGGTRFRPLWGLLVGIAVLSALLSFGGSVYAWYFETPLGSLFRRPHKFLHLYAFAQAGLAGLAIAWLEAHVATARAALWRTPLFIATLALLAGGGLWLVGRGAAGPGLIALTIGLVGYGLSGPGRVRTAMLGGLVGVQGVVLFLGVEQTFVRPAARPQVFDAHADVVALLADRSAGQRVHIEPNIYMLPGLMQKAGTLHGLLVVGDYEPLASQRAADYFGRVTPPRHENEPFTGSLFLDADSRWHLMDLASVGHYVVRGGTAIDRALSEAAASPTDPRVRLIRSAQFPRIYARKALPRARFVEAARYFEDPDRLLDQLASGDFDAANEVLLEGGETPRGRAERGTPGDLALRRSGAGAVEIVVDEPERIVLRTDSETPGWLVVADAWHPGWRATVDGAEAPVRRANYLFRAVPIEAGRSEVEMRFVSRPFRMGLVVSGLTAALLAALAIRWRRDAGRTKSAIG